MGAGGDGHAGDSPVRDWGFRGCDGFARLLAWPFMSRQHAPTTTPDEHVIVLFGATGDLARPKLLPGLFSLDQARLMPERYRIVGTSRDPIDDEGFRGFAHAATAGSSPAH